MIVFLHIEIEFIINYCLILLKKNDDADDFMEEVDDVVNKVVIERKMKIKEK